MKRTSSDTVAKCSLCGREDELQQSHVIPKFVFAWMKKTGGKYFRSLSAPNVRKQDGLKIRLLCKQCEQLLSKDEKWFAESIFHPYLDDSCIVTSYNHGLARFVISVLWRILLLTNEKERDTVTAAVIEDWRSFLLDKRETPQFDDIHLVFIPGEWGGIRPNEYASRYFGRVSDGGIIELPNNIIVFAKLARFFFFGELTKDRENFRGTRIFAGSGEITLPQFIVNNDISRYFVYRADQVYSIFKAKTSHNQLDIIFKDLMKNPVGFINSDLEKRIRQDFNAKIAPYSFSSVHSYACDCCSMHLEAPDGYLLRTFEVVRSTEFWRSFFQSRSIGIDSEGLKQRVAFFAQFFASQSPWVICDSCISMFDVKIVESKKFMSKWLRMNGEYSPPQNGDARKFIKKKELECLAYFIVTVKPEK